MITKAEAEALVRARLDEETASVEGGVMLLTEATLERPYGWVFFYNSTDYVPSGDISQTLVGNCPLLVLASTGEIVELPTYQSVERSLRAHERKHRRWFR